ncbi:UNVERIFIED_CONTAM: hypothetical protein K2H54_057641 [Gekko kuhli]
MGGCLGGLDVSVLLADEFAMEFLVPEPKHETVKEGFFKVLKFTAKSQVVQGSDIVRDRFIGPLILLKEIEVARQSGGLGCEVVGEHYNEIIKSGELQHNWHDETMS